MTTTIYGADIHTVMDLLDVIIKNRDMAERIRQEQAAGAHYDCTGDGLTVRLSGQEIIATFEKRIEEWSAALEKFDIAYADETKRPQLVAAKRPIDVTQPGETK